MKRLRWPSSGQPVGTSLARVPYALLPMALRPLRFLEAWRLAQIDEDGEVRPPPVFIVGAPRTGSTIYYQAVTNAFKVGYISNLSAYFYQSLSLGVALHRYLLGDRAHGCFRSHHGRTRGLASPSETGKPWYRWFPRDRDFVAAGDVSRPLLMEMRRTVAAATEVVGTPFVFKNLNCGQRLQAIREAIPEALAVFVRRDPLVTAFSILQARLAVSGSRERWLSVRPRDHAALQCLPWPEQIARQVHSLERQINEDLARFPEAQVLRVRYEDFVADPQGELSRFGDFLARNRAPTPRRIGASAPELRSTDGLSHSSADLALLREAVERLDWSHTGRIPTGGTRK